MLQLDSISSSYPVISAGPDWITATAKKGSNYRRFCEVGDRLIEERRDARRAISSASRFGFRGWAGSDLFFGVRDDDALIVSSGPETVSAALPIIEVADNVSRLDLQVTVWTHGEQPHLAMESYHRLARSRHEAHRPGQVTLITTDPQGETLNVNKRTSDTYGRLYDKASEAKIGPARTIWRAEVEFKRRVAFHHALALYRSDCLPSFTRNIVHTWWRSKGVEPPFEISEGARLEPLNIEKRETDVIDWFEKSVSITVARAVKLRGLSVTLAALGLSALVEPKRKEDRSFYANRLGLVPSEVGR